MKIWIGVGAGTIDSLLNQVKRARSGRLPLRLDGQHLQPRRHQPPLARGARHHLHRARHLRCPDLSTPPDGARPAGAHRCCGHWWPVHPRDRPQPQGGHRKHDGTRLLEARPSHARVPLLPKPAPPRRASPLPGRRVPHHRPGTGAWRDTTARPGGRPRTTDAQTRRPHGRRYRHLDGRPEVPRTDRHPAHPRGSEGCRPPRATHRLRLPVALTNNLDGARESASHIFQNYGRLPSYRAVLDVEGAPDPADVAIIGSEDEVAQRSAISPRSASPTSMPRSFPSAATTAFTTEPTPSSRPSQPAASNSTGDAGSYVRPRCIRSTISGGMTTPASANALPIAAAFGAKIVPRLPETHSRLPLVRSICRWKCGATYRANSS